MEKLVNASFHSISVENELAAMKLIARAAEAVCLPFIRSFVSFTHAGFVCLRHDGSV